MYDADGEYQVSESGEDGIAIFKDIPYDEEGDYSYKITEVPEGYYQNYEDYNGYFFSIIKNENGEYYLAGNGMIGNVTDGVATSVQMAINKVN